MSYGMRVATVAFLVTTAVGADRTARAVTVDNFSEGPFSIDVAAFSWAENTQTGLQEENVLGGERYIRVSNVHGWDPASAVGGSGDAVLTFYGDVSIHSTVQFAYDGGSTLSRDLTSPGRDAFQITVTTADAGGALDMQVETHVGESSYRKKNVPLKPITNPGSYLFAFDEFSGGGASGFADVDVITVYLTRATNYAGSYTISDIRTVATLSADFDLDFDVDGDDFLIWQSSFGVDDGGDADDDNDTDGDDFLVWQNQFGNGSGSASVVVPEPTSVGLLLVVGAAFFGSRGWRLTEGLSKNRASDPGAPSVRVAWRGSATGT